MLVARGNRGVVPNYVPNQLVGASPAFKGTVVIPGQCIGGGGATHYLEIRNRIVPNRGVTVCRTRDQIDRHATRRMFVADGVEATTTSSSVQRIVTCSAFQYVAEKTVVSGQMVVERRSAQVLNVY